MGTVITTDSLTKTYGKKDVVKDLDLRVPGGSIYGFLGPNGAGKSTTMKMILGLIKPSKGEITVLGKEVNEKNRLSVLRNTGSLIEAPSYYGHLSGVENLEIICTLKNVPLSEIQRVLKIVRMEKQKDKKVSQYSLGMKQRLGIAVALAGDPDFLVLDEPINGLDPQGIIEMRELILKLNREHQITVLISSHILDELSRLATHYGFIDQGHIVKEISAEELENACRKCTRVKVSDTVMLAKVLDGMSIDYDIISESEADIYKEVNVSELSLALAKEGASIISMSERDESLESYFISLVGGGSRD